MRNCYRLSWAFSIFILAFLASCKEEQPQRRLDRPSLQAPQPPVRITAETKGEVKYGDNLRFSVESENASLAIAEVKVSSAESRKLLAASDDGRFDLATSLTGGGVVKLRIDVTFADGQSSMRYKDFTVVAPVPPQRWGFEVVRRYPHDKGAFTQGLLVHKGFLYEGTGNLGESRIRKVNLTTGEVLLERHNAPDIFGEGITIIGNKLYQITYKSAIGYVYNLEDFSPAGEFSYSTITGEGWGLTHNDTALVMSDGSAHLYFLDPETFAEKGRVRVFDDRGEVGLLNELEYKDGLVYANIYTSAEIVAIDAKTGMVRHRYTARGMVDRSEVTSDMDVLNGIAFHPTSGNLLITGKYWKTLYEVKPILM